MRRTALSALAALGALVLAGTLLAQPAAAEDLSDAWDNGMVGTSSYRQSTFYKTIDGLDAHAEITGTITTTWVLQELSAAGSSYRYWKLHVNTVIDPKKRNEEYLRTNDDLWTRVTVWPQGASELQKWATESKTIDTSNCKTVSIGIGGSAGPFSASMGLADWRFCDEVKLASTQNPQDIWRQHYVVRDFDRARDYGVVYILKTPRHQMPRFNIDVDFPKDTGPIGDATSITGGYSKLTPRSGRY